jgi:hypothetical protein
MKDISFHLQVSQKHKERSQSPVDRNEGKRSLKNRQAVVPAFQTENGETQFHHLKNFLLYEAISKVQRNVSAYVSPSDYGNEHDKHSLMPPFRSNIFLIGESKSQASDRHDTA